MILMWKKRNAMLTVTIQCRHDSSWTAELTTLTIKQTNKIENLHVFGKQAGGACSFRTSMFGNYYCGEDL